ncbi:hypothetical protein IHC93_19895 [Photobacterium damselae subsp. damselae]|uniref:hypothetical protein n=1 Tax=Photobacterium damselae TaxID=38293 RepID=UPI001F237814|nr:hypothetical protein [Photobacterium damselae]UKA27188.1 hypothetical protein IHC93_19895 [Photobacterium damselae subsp. damselae]
MKKFRVAEGKSLDTKAGLVRGGGFVREIDLLASVEVLLMRRLIIDDGESTDINTPSGKVDNLIIGKQNELNELSALIEDKEHYSSELDKDIESKETKLAELNKEIEQQQEVLEALNNTLEKLDNKDGEPQVDLEDAFSSKDSKQPKTKMGSIRKK